MGGYGYSYQTYTTYNTVGAKTEEPLGPAIRRPFVPFVPNSNRNPEGYVTRKTEVPISTRPYGDDYSSYNSTTKAYPTRDDDEYWQRQTSPVRPQKVDDFLTKVQNEASRPPRSSPVDNPVRNDNYYGNGYGDYGNYNDKERYKPIGSGIRNENYDRYQPAENYSSLEPNRNSASGWSRPSWTAPPRSGTQLSESTNDIGKALGLLKEAAKVSSNGYGDYGNKGRPKDEGYYGVDRPNPTLWAEPPGNGGSHVREREPRKVDKAMELAREAERLKSLNRVLGEPTTTRKDDYYYREPVDSTDASRRKDDERRYANNLSSRPTSIIDSQQARKKYNGARV